MNQLTQSMTIKACVQTKYGPTEVLAIQEVEKPTPKDHEVLIKVKAISLNPAEWHIMRGSIWMIRLVAGFTKPRNPVMGADISGVVEAVGKKVKTYQIGDPVLGRNFIGGLAEYACLEESKSALIPSGISFETAATIPLASVTALIALRDKGKIASGQSVLINGASGGIGTFAVQLAKYFKTKVTAVCSEKNIDLVRSLGADKVIDYNQEDFTQSQEKYDLVIDLIGNRTRVEINQILKPKSRCVLVGFTNFSNMFGFMIGGTLSSIGSNKKYIVMDAPTRRDDLEYIANLVTEGNIKPIIDKTYDFEKIREAFDYLGTRRARGKIVIKL